MLANAAGPIAQLYLLVMGLPKYAFIGTSAWLFLIVNVCKVPFMIDLKIITLDSMTVSGWMFIPAIIGCFDRSAFSQVFESNSFRKIDLDLYRHRRLANDLLNFIPIHE